MSQILTVKSFVDENLLNWIFDSGNVHNEEDDDRLNDKTFDLLLSFDVVVDDDDDSNCWKNSSFSQNFSIFLRISIQ